MIDYEWPQGAHDAWLASYSQTWAEVWCSNPKCVAHHGGVEVQVITQYGQSWCEPEECECHHSWLHERPEEEEDEDDDQ